MGIVSRICHGLAQYTIHRCSGAIVEIAVRSILFNLFVKRSGESSTRAEMSKHKRHPSRPLLVPAITAARSVPFANYIFNAFALANSPKGGGPFALMPACKSSSGSHLCIAR